MNHQFISTIALLSPTVFILTALISWFQPGIRPLVVKKISTVSASLNILIAALCSYSVIQYGLLETPLLGIKGVGLSIRLDALNMLLFSMIALLSFIVIRFSHNYLDGDSRQGAFIGRLTATIASVQLFVLSGNLGLLFLSWVLTSVSLHRLLIFYKERPGARIAARKKFIIARLGDACLLAAVVLLYNQFGTGNLEEIFLGIKNNLSNGSKLEVIALLIAAAALLKSAQFPTHGWLVEVMETPTPVSALLHAGLLNAGPFLIVRMASVMEATSYASIVLMVVGAFTALFASVVYLTQTSIKTALAYSSIGHMGFSLMVCGLGVYPAAILHLVAHSFYKAHAFLSSGSVIEVMQSSKITSAKRIGSPIRIAFGILLSIVVYVSFAFAWGIDLTNEISLVAIGAVILMGLAHIFTSAIDSTGSLKLLLRACLLSVIVATAFFSLEAGTRYLLASQLPELTQPSFLKIIIMSSILLIFGAAVFIQIITPSLQNNSYYKALAIHLRNGLYVNAIFDRWVRAFYAHERQVQEVENSRSINIETYKTQTI